MNNPNDGVPVNAAPNIGPSESASLPAHPAGYGDLLLEIKAQIRPRQFQALRAANRELLALYWWLGENISQRQLARRWGKGVVENLARDLQAEFPGRNGFSAQNLWLMREFFNEYGNKPKLQSLMGEISWAQNLVILARCHLHRHPAAARQLPERPAQPGADCGALASLGGKRRAMTLRQDPASSEFTRNRPLPHSRRALEAIKNRATVLH